MSLRPLAVGVGSGSVGTVLLKLCIDLLQSPAPPFLLGPLEQGPEEEHEGSETCDCGEGFQSILHSLGYLDFEKFHGGSLVLGLALGICFWPLLDLLVLLRLRWNRVLFRAQAQTRIGSVSSSYRLLSESVNE